MSKLIESVVHRLYTSECCIAYIYIIAVYSSCVIAVVVPRGVGKTSPRT